MTEPMKIRTEHGCVIEHDIIKLRDMKTFDADVEVRILKENMQRKMVELSINDTKMFADVVTGTLYSPATGKCNSTNIWIERTYRGGKIWKRYPQTK